MIQMPLGWGWDRLRLAAQSLGSARKLEYWPDAASRPVVPTVRRIGLHDLRDALRQGFRDFEANRTDVLVLCVVYPLFGLIMGRAASGNGLVPLLFPLAAGFILVGPLAAVGLNEMSRLREQGQEVSWVSAFNVLRSPSIGSIVLLGLMLIALFLLWLFAAEAIYEHTLGPNPPPTVLGFFTDVFTTGMGWTMIVVGMVVGFLFALAVLVTSVVSFPLLLDRDVSFDTAISTSIRAVMANKGPMAVWGLIVAAGLVIGSIPFLLGLIIILPVLGHATWHLYRRVVAA